MRSNVIVRILLLTLLSPLSFAGPTGNFAPNWSVMETRLFQEPAVVLDELESLETETWLDTQKVQYYELLSAAYFLFSDYERAKAALDQGWALKERAEPYVLVNLMTSRAYFKELSGELEQAEADLQTALRVAEQSGNYDAILSALNALIAFYSFTQEQYDTALEYVDRGSEITHAIGREFLIGDLYSQFGSILSYLGDSEAALKQYENAQSVFEKHDNVVSMSALIYNRATLYESMEDFIAAIRTYQAFIDAANQWGDPTAAFFGNMGLANSYSLLDSFEEAHKSILLAQNALPYVVDPIYQFDFWSTASYIAADVEDFEFAEKAVAQTQQLADRIADDDLSWYRVEAMNTEKYLAKKQENFEKAFELSEEIRWLQNDLLIEEQEQALTSQRINSENAIFQSETDRLAQESRRQQEVIAAKNQLQQILLILLVMLSVSLFALGITLRRKIRQMRILQQYSAISESVKTSGQRVMENVAGLMFDQSERRKSPLSVIVFDFNTMSDLREQFGQQAVDDANHWVKEILDAELRDEDKCGQINFERYMMLVPGADIRLARKQADRIIQFFKENTVPGWPNIKLQVSAGISERSKHDRNPNVLTHRASTAVDMARDGGAFNVKVLAV